MKPEEERVRVWVCVQTLCILSVVRGWEEERERERQRGVLTGVHLRDSDTLKRVCTLK